LIGFAVLHYPFNYIGSAPKRLVVVAEPIQTTISASRAR